MSAEADNSEYWDALARGMGLPLRGEFATVDMSRWEAPSMPQPPAFGGYVAVPRNHGDADFYAWRSDGKLAKYRLWFGGNGDWHEDWVPCLAPDFDTLFPASPSAPFVTAASNPTVGEGPRPEADQPRPDDADETAYPRTRRGRDD